VFVPPSCEDSGQALGAALYLLCVVLGATPKVALPFLGLGASDGPPRLTDDLADRVVADLLAGRVVAWHWGRAEIGPRALGHRSLLAAPLNSSGRALVSEKVKGREPYRPVAPIILATDQADWFGNAPESPYMLFAGEATALAKDRAPATVHVDGSARLQTIGSDHILDCVLRRFADATGVPMLINTSLNGPRQPILQTHDQTLQFAAQHEPVVAYLEGVRHAV
jgi:carbamoyltransferase